jgi:site-specific DNA recombinase
MIGAVAYARYSSDNQRVESITAQLRAIHAYALKENIQITNEYIDEAESATKDDRPSFQRMISELEKTKPNLVLVHKFDRFARDRIDAGHYKWIMKKKGVRLIAVDQDFGDTPEGSLVESTVEGVAEYFSKNLSREVKKGQFENVEKGMHIGGTPPLGLDLDTDKKYIINEREAIAVRLIFSMKLDGHSYPDIMKILNVNGYTTKRGNPFGKNSLHEILRNEKYIGTYVYRKTSPHSSRVAADPLATVRKEGMIPRIIDDDTFSKVQELMDNHKYRPRATSETIYILAGIAKCAECGMAMVGDSYTSKGKKYTYYRCNNAVRTHSIACSNTKKYNKDHIEDEVIRQAREAIEKVSGDTDSVINYIYEGVQARADAENNTRRVALTELHKIQSEIDNLIASIARGVDAGMLAPMLNELGKKKEVLTRQSERVEPIVSRDNIKQYVDNILSKPLDISDPIMCREDLKSLFDEIVIAKDGVILPLERLGL